MFIDVIGIAAEIGPLQDVNNGPLINVILCDELGTRVIIKILHFVMQNDVTYANLCFTLF